MKYILYLIIFFSIFSFWAYAQDYDFQVEKGVEVEQASLKKYQDILYKNAKKERSQKIREKLERVLKKWGKINTVDYSYRYQKKSIQKRALSCEISITSDIISRHSARQVTEDYLVKKIHRSAYNQLPKNIDGRLVWGDPNTWFVWYIDHMENGKKASQWNMTWYGVLEKPIMQLYDMFGLETRFISGAWHRSDFTPDMHLTHLLQQLEKWNSVQLWGDYCTDPDYEDTEDTNSCKTLNDDRTREWYYKDRNGDLQKHVWLAGEHAFMLLWYTGNIFQPTEVIVWDSRTGKHKYKKKEWMRKWKMMQYRSIIVYDED